MRKILFVITIFILVLSCKDDVLPKPKAYLSLNYAPADYSELAVERPYSFLVSDKAELKEEKNNWLKIKYPKLKASIDITYRPVEGNLKELLIESEKLVYKHAVKAEQIVPKDYLNESQHVYGSLYEITGNAASQIQFHITDSTKNFIKGSLYFYTKPNYDSVLPAVAYIKKDIMKLMETLKWEN
ncbi:gliding motility lipoprotein GldD [Flavobacteriaceae bacterium S356]|uniref:Gliding motility lipoprotein GldD n=1 Tax=Asprobacillus argus TaxID=3076534 RepID=A0ABU3LHN8_9FLAO|nr:gliding motility lipoprotein GldD [Flavobacteriaceae bacterium S356]